MNSNPPNSQNTNTLFDTRLKTRYRWDTAFQTLSWIAVILSIVVLAVLLIDVFFDGLPRLDWKLLTSFPSRRPEDAGLKSALVGTIWLMILTAIITFPIGVGAGIFLEEFSAENTFTKIIEVNINNLAAVPSIIYGLLGLQVFVRLLSPMTGGRSVLAGALTLSLLILPIVIVATREALKAVPDSLRQAGLALGATKWQVVREQIFPLALPGILTGTILALSRAIGETAPLITLGALTFIAFLPSLSLEGLQTPFTALPIQIFNWVSRPQEEFHTVAAAGIIVLMVVLLAMNGTAIFLRNKFQK
ncbi:MULTISPECIES: phosphate ABC transporter permease PstA [Cyanophyceae]|uniref:phosphate ABC transporter permease PstA n=1 Tax=Cyanophyceae TaxID=3028117 RepID=UPI00016DCB17|nr:MULTISPECIES: phosphate ABC transporter permease PstA [Cyanophyceae]ACB00265.1 phosphate ABC transporter, permease protein [Picosynechococcus sp. PCC 7002]AMA09875.1 phosphate ABC transporter permease [Picosynechococcus sp. PCC 73109]QCS50754.1 phosphate ABC transporter permease PstA [Picosynechococcus sp. PCC 11901]SMH52686.1 phosphate ABC transporter membrane protein 2, PhoT family [Picosynechococcus sp. OG1]SMQ82401.1 phosphate ABC transporter membrane protein 2, PhoT family [Synechococc